MEILTQTIHSVADWLTLIGFLLTVITMLKVFFLDKEVKKINKQHLYEARINAHVKELKTTSSKVANLISSTPIPIKEFRVIVVQCRMNCISLGEKVSKNKFENLNLLIKESRKIVNNKIPTDKKKNWFGKKPIAETDIERYYEILTSLISEIEHYNADLKKQ